MFGGGLNNFGDDFLDDYEEEMTPAIAASKAELITLALTPEDLEKLMYLDAGTTFRLVLKNPTDKDNVVQTKGATEQIVLKDIGHASTAGIKDPELQQQISQANHQTSYHEHNDQVPVDDGKVEIMFGSEKRREVRKYSGPASNKLNSQNFDNNPLIPHVEQIRTSEEN